MGGKATDVSWTLASWAFPRGRSVLPQDRTDRMETMLRQRRRNRFHMGGRRDPVKHHHRGRQGGQSTITSSTLKVAPEHVADFAARYQKALQGASCVVMEEASQAACQWTFTQMPSRRHTRQNVPVISIPADLLFAGVKSRPDVIKPNLTELGELLGHVPASQSEMRRAAEKLRDEYGSNVIVTMGSQGAIAVFSSGSYFVHPLSIPVERCWCG